MPSYFAKTFYALEYDRFRIMWFGTLFSFLGMQMQVLARGYLAFELTGKNSALGGVMLAFGLPQLILSLVGGVIADRLPKRKVLWVSQSVTALNSAWLATMIETGNLEYWMLIVAGIIQGSGFAFVGPARQAYIAELVPKDALGNAVVLQQLSMNSTRVIGPSIAGALIGIAFIGAGGVYYLTTLGFIIAMLSLLKLPPGEPLKRAVKTSAFTDIKEGIAYVKNRRPIALLILSSFFVIMLGFPYQSFMPALAKDHFGVGASKLGLLSSVAAVGAVAATIFVATYAGHRRAWQISTFCGIGFAIALIGLALSPSYLVGLIAMVFLGGLASGFQSMNNSLCMQMTDNGFTGRVQSINGLAFSFFGVAALPIGILADHIGLRETLVLMGCLILVALTGLEFLGRSINIGAEREKARDTTPRRVTAGGGH